MFELPDRCIFHDCSLWILENHDFNSGEEYVGVLPILVLQKVHPMMDQSSDSICLDKSL